MFVLEILLGLLVWTGVAILVASLYAVARIGYARATRVERRHMKREGRAQWRHVAKERRHLATSKYVA